jgi:hypothetical protein
VALNDGFFLCRPLLDERGKKVWELLICDPERTFEYSEFFPNSRINSGEVGIFMVPAAATASWLRCANPCSLWLHHVQLKRAIESILSRPGSVRPEKARFFRSQ